MIIYDDIDGYEHWMTKHGDMNNLFDEKLKATTSGAKTQCVIVSNCDSESE